MAWPRGLREAALALVVASAVIVPLGLTDFAPLRALETGSLDLRFRLRGVIPQSDRVAVILVDDRSLEALGRWPLSRHLFAKAVRDIDRAGAKVIAFDLLFAEPEPPATSGPAAGNDPDADFAGALRDSGKVLLPFAFSFGGKAPAEEPPAWFAEQAYQRFDKSPVEPEQALDPQGLLAPFAPLAEAAAGLGHVNIAYDRDGAPRYDYLALQFNGDFAPSLPVRAVAAYRGVAWSEVGLALGAGVTIGAATIPTDRAARLAINYRGPRGTIPTYSFADLIAGKIAPERLAGRIVIIGASAIGIADTNPAPFESTQMPGAERIANIIDTMLTGDFIGESPPPWPTLTIALTILLAAATAAVSAILPTALAGLAGVVPVLAWCGATVVAFRYGLWLPLVKPVIALGAAMLTTFLFRYVVIDHQRRRIQVAFRHYLAPELVNALAAHPEQLRLGGETRMVTLMFSDIRGFTTISETFKSNPEGLSRLINRGFLTPMTGLIMARGGTIDKYIGDCIMAFWNAPLDDPGHADHACASALAMLDELDRINPSLEAEAGEEGRPFHPIHIGIGLNTGECVVGNMGSDERFAYTAMGDAVNLASRLEGQSKTYRVPIVLGEATRQAAPGWAFVEIDLIAVKGKRDAVRIYTLLGDAAVAQSAGFQAHARRHQTMLAAYRRQDWAAAAAAIAACRAYDPRLDGLYDLYRERIADFAANPPGPNWDGVFVAETK